MIEIITLPDPLIPLQSAGLTLQEVGGKALNLARLAGAGLPIPPGFFIPTSCYEDYVRQNGLGKVIWNALGSLDPDSFESLELAAAQIRQAFSAGTFSSTLAAALERGWHWLGKVPVAVRSSATAEDLPGASFAGQQDTFLNVIGEENLIRAVVDCWSSLWTGRAISYRARNQISHTGAALCVVVQQMVPADVSGVMFTANPLTGRRTEMVIDATLGLGEVLVSGQVSPDSYLLAVRRIPGSNHRDGMHSEVEFEFDIKHKTLGSKGRVITAAAEGGLDRAEGDASHIQALPDHAILGLAGLGMSISDLYGHPQDIEWAWLRDRGSEKKGPGEEGQYYILQSRPVTSLFPLPENLDPAVPRFLVGFHAVQGVMEPLTPLGQDTMKHLFAGAGELFGVKTSPEAQTALFSAAERLWLNFTPVLRSHLGSKVFPRMIKEIDPGVAAIVEEIKTLPCLAPSRRLMSLKALRGLLRFFLPILIRVLRALRHPEQERQEILHGFDQVVCQTARGLRFSGDLWADFQESLVLLENAPGIFADFVLPRGFPPIMAAIAPFFSIMTPLSNQAARLVENPRISPLRLEIARSLPHNVTTEMDLALWQTAVSLKSAPQVTARFQTSEACELSRSYQQGTLDPAAQKAIGNFLERYGGRGPGEVDLGRKRWSEDPTPVMQALQSYLKINDPQLAPDTVFARGVEKAEKATETLSAAVARLPFGWLKVRLLRFAISRFRALAGMREAPKFFAVRMMTIIRQELLRSGGAMTAAGMLERPDDLFFLRTAELHKIGSSRAIPKDYRALIDSRRKTYDRELGRPRLPLVFLHDGTTFYSSASRSQEKGFAGGATIQGDPVSPGVAEGRVRVVLKPHKSDLVPGEILVCVGTDPSWTPLFLAAAGLVMEVGGLMTHGSVVAREYGIPAIVGFYQATIRLRTGMLIRLDGNSGSITILE